MLLQDHLLGLNLAYLDGFCTSDLLLFQLVVHLAVVDHVVERRATRRLVVDNEGGTQSRVHHLILEHILMILVEPRLEWVDIFFQRRAVVKEVLVLLLLLHRHVSLTRILF